MRIKDLMKQDVKCASLDHDVEATARLMRDHNIGFVPVCDDQNRVVGTITDRDLCIRVLAEGRPGSTKVSDCMSREVVSCQPNDSLTRAEELLAQHQKSRLVVVDEQGRLAGVLSLSDIAQADSGRRVADTLRRVTEREAHVS